MMRKEKKNEFWSERPESRCARPSHQSLCHTKDKVDEEKKKKTEKKISFESEENPTFCGLF